VRVGSADRAVGFLYTFVMNRKVSFFQSGFHYGQDARLSPGLLTLAAAIDDYRRSGQAEFDFLAGEAPYKRALAKKQRELNWTIVYRNRPLMRVLLALRIVKNRVIGA
jgi:CelD/BcsL family acetyltransferase involved in cellulose biosynthesis